MTGAGTPNEPADIRIVSRNVTPEQAAAVTAVLQATLIESADLAGGDEEVAKSQWAQQQRPIRIPLQPGAGAWRASSRR